MQYTEKISSKLYNYFTQRLVLKDSTKGWKRGDCIYCGGKYTMGINFYHGRIHCFKDNCLEDKNLMTVLMDMENFETVHQARNFLNIQEEYEGFDRILTQQREHIIERKDVTLPTSFKLLNQTTKSLLSKSAQEYLKGRNFDINRLSRKGVGFCTNGPYGGYVIFPIYEAGKLIFYQGRKFTAFGTKMKNPEYEAFGIGKSELIYNADALYIYKTCYLMESITNCETLGDRGVGFLGKKPSPEQMRKIINSPCEGFIIILDPDAIFDSIHLALSICQIKRIKLVIMPEGEDVNSYGRKRTLELVKKTKWGTYRDFFKLKIDYEGAFGSYN